MVLILIFLYFSISYSLNEDWTIHIYTGTERFAGTDSDIFIRMFNSKHGYTREYELTHENWLLGNSLFPFKNLFEYGQHDRFRISTENFEFVEKIHVRRDNFPLIRSDWFLDQIIVERNRDSAKFIFKCNCWLQTEQPSKIISISSDLRSIDKNNSSKDNQIILVIFIISIVFISIICSICCIHEYCRHRHFQPIQIEQESPCIIDRSYPPSAPPPPCLHDNTNSLETLQHVFSSVNNTRCVTIQSIDEPPAYHDLFPD